MKRYWILEEIQNSAYGPVLLEHHKFESNPLEPIKDLWEKYGEVLKKRPLFEDSGASASVAKLPTFSPERPIIQKPKQNRHGYEHRLRQQAHGKEYQNQQV